MGEVIRVENLTKIYKLYDKPQDRLREALNPFKKKYHRDFFALKNVSFDVKSGETIGLIGKNGSGKSTLLKLITGILTPTSGTVQVNGRIAALLELGAGFNLEYTGLENIYLNGALMGFSKEDIDSKLDNILSFADIGSFINQPVKVYSSGMFARLAFAMAIHVDPEILIIDEALAVGDAAFQNKCYKRLSRIQEDGTTILFVSHQIGTIKTICDRVLWLDSGNVKMVGDKEGVCSAYMNDLFLERNKVFEEQLDEAAADGAYDDRTRQGEKGIFPKLTLNNNLDHLLSPDLEVVSFFIQDQAKRFTRYLVAEEKYEVHVACRFNVAIDNAIIGVALETDKGIPMIGFNTFLSKRLVVPAEKGEVVEAVFSVVLPKIRQGVYLINIGIAKGSQENPVIMTWLHNCAQIEIINSGYNISNIEIDHECLIKKYKEVELY